MSTNDSDFDELFKKLKNNPHNVDIDKIKEVISNQSLMLTEKINLLFTGSTLCGKSTTIEMLEKDAIKDLDKQYPSNCNLSINHTPFPSLSKDPFITDHPEVCNLTCWETLGFGLCQESDRAILDQIKKKMNTYTQSTNSKYFIDLTIIIHDYSFSDWKTTYDICNDLNYDQRVLLAINQKEEPSSDNAFLPEIPSRLKDLCNEKNIAIFYYNSHDEVSIRCLLLIIIALIRTRKNYPLLIIKDKSEPLINTNKGTFSNSSTLISQLKAWGEIIGFTDVMNTMCDTFNNVDSAFNITADFKELLSTPNPAKKCWAFIHLMLTFFTIIREES